jgi:hypothetical protein
MIIHMSSFWGKKWGIRQLDERKGGFSLVPDLTSIRSAVHGTVGQIGNLPLGHGLEQRLFVAFRLLCGCQTVLFRQRVVDVEQPEWDSSHPDHLVYQQESLVSEIGWKWAESETEKLQVLEEVKLDVAVTVLG